MRRGRSCSRFSVPNSSSTWNPIPLQSSTRGLVNGMGGRSGCPLAPCAFQWPAGTGQGRGQPAQHPVLARAPADQAQEQRMVAHQAVLAVAPVAPAPEEGERVPVLVGVLLALVQ